jgi:hypothetical protein
MACLYDLAKTLRSKNAGPLQVTFDVMFATQALFDRVLASRAISCERISHLYAVPESEVRIIPYAAALAIKITIPRNVISGDPGDQDIYGCQQHLALGSIDIT